MPAVRLGRIHLRWCCSCNLPVLESGKCGVCDSDTFPVAVTPPGDARPAFECDVLRVRATTDAQFGTGCGAALVPDGKLALLNRVPALDAMDEVIVDGEPVAMMRFDPGQGWKMLLRMPGARRIAKIATKSFVVIDDGAVGPMLKGASAMAVGVLNCDPAIAPGDEVLVVTKDKLALSVGTSRMPGSGMVGGRGPAVKNRWAEVPTEPKILPAGQTWANAVKASRKALDKRRATARKFITGLVNRGKPIAVSFSGGKDSLAVLLLALESGLEPPMIFVDTGIELPETVAHVHDVAAKYGLELVEERAPDSFWNGMSHFGPPAKDFRWCCKTCKLGPTSRIIRRRFPGGVLSLIGQRRYESEQRSKKGSVWMNPWVPGQDAASPIQEWTALHVWLYIFQQGAPYNVWYERGMPRIGCWTCPSADLADVEAMRVQYNGYGRYTEELKRFASENGYPDDWVKLGLWRWKDGAPQEMAALCKGPMRGEAKPRAEKAMTDEEKARVAEMLFITDGSAESLDGKKLVVKALHCQACGICVARCAEGALELRGGKVRLDVDKCKKCLVCMSPCPVADFEPR
ncbi:MAG: phosphoadenosine phosphosulfate reductase family protein [Methanobacteriota archaeon]